MKASVRLFILTVLLSLMTSGCARNNSFETQEIPKEVVRIDDLFPEDSKDSESPVESISGDEPATNEEPDSQKPTESQPQTPTAPKPEVLEKGILSTAKWVIKNEARQVGPACNRFVQRVLVLLGFSKEDWMANDFDVHAKKNFESYKVETFSPVEFEAEQKKLKAFLEKVPENTGLILQWKRARGHGHIAILERVGSQYVIYHASLNKFNPKAQKAELETIFYRSSVSYRLNIFFDLKKKSGSWD